MAGSAVVRADEASEDSSFGRGKNCNVVDCRCGRERIDGECQRLGESSAHVVPRVGLISRCAEARGATMGIDQSIRLGLGTYRFVVLVRRGAVQVSQVVAVRAGRSWRA